MKTASRFHLALGLFIIPFLASCLALPPQESQAQDSGYLEPSEAYSREELAQMLAPIALYPDALLSQILMASTYPIEVVEADRWAKMNSELKGETLDTALLDKEWDPSVKAICHFPSILALMSERITETTNLGNAFLAQETEVMDMVQELRAKAYAQGNLASTSKQKVIVEKETIIIQPADPRVIYVPYYDPFYIYGPWWYPAHRPYSWGPPGISIGLGISYWPGFYFGFTFGAWSHFDWHRHYIYINVHKRPRFVRHDRWVARPGRWHHTPRHRRGVAYRDKPTARKYGQYPYRSRVFRRDTRGFPEHWDRDQQVRKRAVSDRQKRLKIERTRQERERIERNRQMKQKADQEKRVRERAESDRQERLRIERDRQKRERVAQDQQQRQRADQERQVREKADRNKQKRQQIERDKQARKRIVSDQQDRLKVKRAQQQGSRDNVFSRVEDGRKERQSSKRGRVSRQGLDKKPRSKNRSADGDKSVREKRSRRKAMSRRTQP